MKIRNTMLFGVFAVHSPESCPLNNKVSKEMFVQIQEKIEAKMEEFKIFKLIGFYMSVLEHEWIIVVDADNSHDIERLCIEVGISSVSTIKIVPLNYYSDAIKKMKSM